MDIAAGAGFRALPEATRTVEVELDGRPVPVDPERSLLANLLLLGRPSAAFLCAIGHCQRCLLAVDGEPALACRTYLAGGERVTT